MNITIQGYEESEERDGINSGSRGVVIGGVGDAARGVRKGSWTEEEDILLRLCIEKHGEGNWRQVPNRAGLNRCRKSCRLRWLNYLHPNINRSRFAHDEADLIIRLHKLLGNRWSLIARRFPGRTANDVKNYWNTHIHIPSSSPYPKNPTILNTKVEATAAAPATMSSTAKPTTSSTTKQVSHKISHEVIKPQPRTLNKSWTWSASRFSSPSTPDQSNGKHIKEETNGHQHEPRREVEDLWKHYLMQEDEDEDSFYHNIWSSNEVDGLSSTLSDLFVPDALAPPTDGWSTLPMDELDPFCMVSNDFSLETDFWNIVTD